MKGERKLAQSSRSRLHFIGTLIRSPSLIRGLALRNPVNMTWREEDSRRVDPLEDRTTHGMRHRTISRVETRDTHQEGWKETDDEGSLGRQQFHA